MWQTPQRDLTQQENHTWEHIVSTMTGLPKRLPQRKEAKPTAKQFVTATSAALAHFRTNKPHLAAEPIFHLLVNGKSQTYLPQQLRRSKKMKEDLADVLHTMMDKSLSILQNPSLALLHKLSRVDGDAVRMFFNGKQASVTLIYKILKGGYVLWRNIPNFVSLYDEVKHLTTSFSDLSMKKMHTIVDITKTAYIAKIMIDLKNYLQRKNPLKGHVELNQTLDVLKSFLTEHINEGFEKVIFQRIESTLNKRKKSLLQALKGFTHKDDAQDLQHLQTVVGKLDEIVRAYHHLAKLFPKRYQEVAKRETSELITTLQEQKICQKHAVMLTPVAADWAHTLWPTQPLVNDISSIIDIDYDDADMVVLSAPKVKNLASNPNLMFIDNVLPALHRNCLDLMTEFRLDVKYQLLFNDFLAQPWYYFLNSLGGIYEECHINSDNILEKLENSRFIGAGFSLISALRAHEDKIEQADYRYCQKVILDAIEQYQNTCTAIAKRQEALLSSPLPSDTESVLDFDDNNDNNDNEIIITILDPDTSEDNISEHDDGDALVVKIFDFTSQQTLFRPPATIPLARQPNLTTTPTGNYSLPTTLSHQPLRR